MKSRKLKAVLAAVSAIAVLATAMTGFAATITTETTYNVGSANKATVRTIVSGLEDKTAEVTLLVKTVPGAGVGGSEIAYIDQKPASAGEAIFEYQLDKTALSDATQATVITGNDSDNGADKIGNSSLNVAALEDISSDDYTVAYNGSVTYVGTEEIIASFTPASGKEIEKIVVGEVTYVDTFGAVTLEYVNGVLKNVPVVTIKADAETPNLTEVSKVVSDDNTKITTLMKIVGEPDEVGVVYGDYKYKSEDTTGSEYVAISLVAGANVIDGAKIKAYYVVDGTINYAE